MIWPTPRYCDLPERFALQLNDTHPSIGVAELMRLLVDERRSRLGRGVGHHGGHLRLHQPHACCLRRWKHGRWTMFAESLPRHLEIIYEINRRFLDEVRAKFPGDDDRLRRMSLIGEDDGKSVRMAHLATVGSHAINGVAALHSELLKRQCAQGLLRDVAGAVLQQDQRRDAAPLPCAVQPGSAGADRRNHRRRLAVRPRASCVASSRYADDAAFRGQWREVKRANKARLADYVTATTGVELNPDWLFDIQVKRIHEYKRQHLNVLHIITLYHRLKQNPTLDIGSRAFIFGGKAAPGYFMAKRIIKLINAVGETVNNDPDVNRFLRGCVRAELQRAERPPDLPGRRPVGADLDGGQGSLGHRKHEVHAQRCADHRHPRRRERRNA